MPQKYPCLTAEHDSYMIENWDTDTLVDFLKEQNLKLDKNDLEILHKQKVDSQAFLKLTEKKLLAPSYNFPGIYVLLVQELEKGIEKYSIDGNGISTIRQFLLKTYPLEDKELTTMYKRNKGRLGNMPCYT
ncbi:hypothetical protein RhiirC2_857074 [Rhizophagus irregularis]|uniref:SAM domain-containing protein n=1 Tax=Rhizophagus irregularis TaxID=588596 RepID=A0A2N1MEK9_9GLOM|nr:hypothetical protein RhiirC2_857074 [Rhizophagus irregularis]